MFPKRPSLARTMPRTKRGLGRVLVALLFVATVAPAAPADSELESPEARSRRILQLEAEVEAARARLIELVSAPANPGEPALRENPELRRIARELRRKDRELSRLRAAVADASALGATPR